MATRKAPIRRTSRRARQHLGLKWLGAQERTRTFTAVKPLAPEASASTNSATWACHVGMGALTTDRSRACQIDAAQGNYPVQGGRDGVSRFARNKPAFDPRN